MKNSYKNTQNYIIDKTLIPDRCPCCGITLEIRGVHLYCPNKECPEVEIQKIVFWVDQNDISKGISEGIIRKLYNAKKIKYIRDLYLITKDDIKGVEGFQETSAQNVIHSIGLTKKMTFKQLLSKLGIPLVQEKALAKLKIETFEDLISFNDNSSVIGQNVIEWKKDEENLKLLDDLFNSITIIEDQRANLIEVCVTGTYDKLERKELKKVLLEKGYKMSESVSRNTKMLLCSDKNSNSSKMKSAKKQGVQILSYQEFLGE